ncbi:extracellular solute-binding protein [Haladaptatus caseinilyticus]|uniref:extracellular solute-binding protein n=1 Tax=Haladaptatus caseinilyticus TaxID=2993314 RepID=UPI00224AFB3D|nr:extracellular solute-binding protein [Haladaptatus caseinilyticus]
MERRRFLRYAGGSLVLGSGVASVTFAGNDGTSALVAGSLQRLASNVGSASVEAHGSVAARRLIVSGAREPDAVALADPTLLSGLSARASLFATNALVIAYDPESPFAEEVERKWRSAMRREQIVVGRTDPDRDPLGYRTVMALELAGERDLLGKIRVVPETGLLRSLEGGAFDAVFAYRNMAVEHGLPFVTLPDELDFSNPEFGDHYATASVELPKRTVRGAPIRYAATALTEAGKPWVEQLVSGRRRLRSAGFSVPASYPTRTRVRD